MSTTTCAQCVSLHTVLTSFYTTLFIKGTILHHKRNSGIVAHGFEKGRPQERRMWDESDSCAHKKHAGMHTKKRNLCGK